MADSFEYRFRPDVRVVEFDPDTVELRTGVWNPSSITLSDDDRKGRLARIVRELHAGRSHAEVASGTGTTEDEVADVIQALLREEILVPAPAGESARAPYLIARTLGMGMEDRAVPARAMLVAPTALGLLLTGLLPSGLRDRVAHADARLVEDLQSRDLFLDADGLAQSDATERFETWKGAAVVVVWPELNPILLGNLNRLAHLVGFTLLPAAIDGPFAVLGPTVVPSVTSCWACAETRVLDALRDHTLYVDYRTALADGRVQVSEAGEEMNPFLGLLAGLCAWEAMNLMTVGTDFTCGKVLTIYAPTFEVGFHELHVVPGCLVCAPTVAHDVPLYADLQGYLDAVLGSRPSGS